MSYVLITVCRNEQAFISGLIDTVASQTIRPSRWIIVDDGSTDSTRECIRSRATELPFMQLEVMPPGRARNFSSKVFALQHACELAAKLDFDFLGFLDADLKLPTNYYQQLLRLFESNPHIGVAGGSVIDKFAEHAENWRRGSEDFHVAGGVQMFRRKCFVDIGGYLPVDAGGEDTIAEVTAMMKGWKVRTFSELEALHLRPEGVGNNSVIQRGLRWGRRFYLLGYHPLFYLGQCVRRMGQRPILLGSFCQLLGFIVASLKHERRPVSREFVRFHRKLQMARLSKMMGLRAATH